MSRLVFSVGLAVVAFTLSFVGASRLVTADGADGFASVGGITGGAGGQEVVVSTREELMKYTDAKEPYVIYVSGQIPVEGMEAHVRPNKTILGLSDNAELVGGGLYFYNSSNVIVRNLTLRGSSDDGMGLLQTTNVWIDHCTFLNSRDGNLDMRRASDNITVSWCKFAYTAPSEHAFSCLLGSSDSETVNEGKLHVTFHHNWFAEGVKERMPSVRFGTVHVYNNYYNCAGNNYCVRIRLSAQGLVESNNFEGVKNPWEVYETDPSHVVGKVLAKDNLETGVTWGQTTTSKKDKSTVMIVKGDDEVFAPPYEYKPQPASEVKDAVMTGAGAGKIEVKAPAAAS